MPAIHLSKLIPMNFLISYFVRYLKLNSKISQLSKTVNPELKISSPTQTPLDMTIQYIFASTTDFLYYWNSFRNFQCEEVYFFAFVYCSNDIGSIYMKSIKFLQFILFWIETAAFLTEMWTFSRFLFLKLPTDVRDLI